VTKDEIKQAEELAPDSLKSFAEAKGKTLYELFPGSQNMSLRAQLKERGVAHLADGTAVAMEFDTDGKPFAMAAAVSRTPTRTTTYLTDNTYNPDLQDTGDLPRRQKMALYHQVARKEGITNNAIKKKASLVSQEGTYKVRHAKQGKRPKEKVEADLLTLLTYWEENVNSDDENSAVTGSRGVRQVVRRGSRQAMIEGDLFLRLVWEDVKVPPLGNKSYKLPILLQAIPSADIEVAEELIGLGVDLYFWVPESAKIRKLTSATDPEVKKVIKKTVKPDVLNKLKRDGKVLLDPSLLVHIKHAGTDTQPYGQSDIEAALADIAYSRALKSLDTVTIHSLINRMLVIKVGDQNPDSDYHNLAIAQKRVNVFKNLISTIGPNMLILWAGHDITTEDIGAHSTLLDTDDRHRLAGDAIKMASGVPDPILTGSADGGNAVAWAGFIALAAVASELQQEWSQALTQLGRRIAEQNNFADSDVVWEFAHALLADREANATIIMNAFDRGAISRHTLLTELGKDYDVEKLHKVTEKPDKKLFEIPDMQNQNPGGIQGTNPSQQPGRPTKRDQGKTGPDRSREDKDMGN
jgi:hypothetical protein